MISENFRLAGDSRPLCETEFTEVADELPRKRNSDPIGIAAVTGVGVVTVVTCESPGKDSGSSTTFAAALLLFSNKKAFL